MTAHQERTRDGLLQLERTGPFVPPVTLTGLEDLLVTDAFRAWLEHSPLAGTGFRPVQKTRIVRLEWERWDQAGDDPGEYPDGGEPEDYILSRPHDPELAVQIGPLREVVLLGIEEQAEAGLVRDQQVTQHIQASQRAKSWLEQHAGEWLSFADLPQWGHRAAGAPAARHGARSAASGNRADGSGLVAAGDCRVRSVRLIVVSRPRAPEPPLTALIRLNAG